MNEEKLSPPNGVEEHNLREKKEMEQDTGNYTYDFFTFRNVPLRKSSSLTTG